MSPTPILLYFVYRCLASVCRQSTLMNIEKALLADQSLKRLSTRTPYSEVTTMVSSLFPSAVNKTAARRILPFATRIEQLRQMRNGAIQVTYRVGCRRCSSFISKKAFERDFVEFRQQGSKQVSVKRWPAGSYQNHYECRSVDGSRTHTVKALGGLIICSCEDYQHQGGEKHPQCKHVMAVLSHLNYTTLEAYLDAKSAEARASIFAF